jgi:Fe-S cluster biogenesis protein NfuA/nitrite reductase/ring-hydroxylating ferredoxin subunit
MNANAGNGGPVTAAGPSAPSPEELIERVQRLTAELERISDPQARTAAEEMVAAVIELYGQGLERIFTAVSESGDDELARHLAGDGVVASLMLIHGLYPVGLTERVEEALDGVRPYMESHGGDVELLGVEDGIARIRLEGSCDGCPASASTLELAIKSALDEAAPDLEGLVVEGAVQAPAPAAAGPGALELPVIPVATGQSADARPPSWFDLDGVGAVAEGELSSARVGDVALVVARVEGNLLAFRDACAACGASLADAGLDDGTLTCAACERRFFLPRAGRSLDDDRLLLEPVPLLASAAGARVALTA